MAGQASHGLIALVGPEIEENLALRSLSAALGRAGFSAKILPFNEGAALNGLVEELTRLDPPPLLIGLSLAFQWRAPDVLALALALREAGLRSHLTVGGHFGTFAALEVLRDFPEIDSVCRHEAEETLVELAQRLADGAQWQDLRGLAVRDALGTPRANPTRPAPDLATVDWADRTGVPTDVLGHRTASLVGSRGCYANCSFCCIAAWHEAGSPGKRYRLRALTDIADEMAALHHQRQIELFVFHDDNFFLPRPEKNLARIEELARLLEARGVHRYATIVKARPTDVHPEVFAALVQRLHCVRAYVGVETDSDQGLSTLRRGARSNHNWEALRIIDQLGLFACFNLLLFDPDTSLDSLEENLRFIEAHAHHPLNFGRVELYAGTPLLARMQREGRAVGDWLQWDYRLRDDGTERVFQMAARAFYERNFSTSALAWQLMSTRFDAELARKFHPHAYRPAWLAEAKRLSHTLGTDSATGLRRLIAHVKSTPDAGTDGQLAAELAAGLRAVEASVRAQANALERQIRAGLAAQNEVRTPEVA